MDNQQETKNKQNNRFLRDYTLNTLKYKLGWWYSPVLVEKPKVKGQLPFNLNSYIIHNIYY
jgi:hypothetical protein